MGDDGWDSGGESQNSVAVYSATFSRGQGRGPSRSGGRWNNDYGESESWKGRGGGRTEDGGRFRGRGRGQGGGRGYDGRGPQNSSSISVKSSDIGRIIGKGGSKIRDLEQDSGAEIKVKIKFRTMP